VTDKSFDDAVNEKRKELEGLEHAIAMTKKGGHLVGAYYSGLVAEGMPPEMAVPLVQIFNDKFVQGLIDGRCPPKGEGGA